MMRISLKTRIVCLQLCLTLASTLQAADKFVSFIREEGTLELVTSQQRSFSILCADEEHKGVLTAVHNLQEDFYKVADIRPALVADAKQKGSADGQNVRILIGSFDESPFIKQLVKSKKLDARELKGKNEKFIITTVKDPAEGIPGEPENMPILNVNYPLYYKTYQKMKTQYGDKITLKLGMEFGMQVHTIEQYEKLYAKYPFDFIILSVHEVEDKEFWTQDFQRDRTQQEYNERYYEELLYLVQNYHNYSVLGHMDLITRYDKAGTYPFEKLKPIFTEILKTVIADGKGIEVNTSSHRYGLSDLTPSRDILKLYRELGGTIITIGSDSHKPEHLGTFIDETKQELKTLGFKEFCTFDKMKPIYHQL